MSDIANGMADIIFEGLRTVVGYHVHDISIPDSFMYIPAMEYVPDISRNDI